MAVEEAEKCDAEHTVSVRVCTFLGRSKCSTRADNGTSCSVRDNVCPVKKKKAVRWLGR